MFFDVYANVSERGGAMTPIVERVEAGSYTAAISSVYFKLAAECGPGGRYGSYQVVSAVRVDEDEQAPFGELHLGGRG